jgi:hypothetical protein
MARVPMSPPSASAVALALFIAVAGGAFVMVAPACNEVSVLPAPDAGVNCGAPVLVGGTCKEQPVGAAGCPAALGSELCFGRTLSLDAGTYPSGCTVYVNNPTPDEDLQCTQLGGCNCVEEDGGTFAWSCTPCLDAGL